MKKKIVGGIAVMAIAAMATFNLNFNTQQEEALSAITLANVEALAQGEGGVYSDEKVWERFYRSDGTGYNCSKTGSETC